MNVKILNGHIAQDVFKNGKTTAELIPHVWENGEVEPILKYGEGMTVMYQTAMSRGVVVNAETNEPIILSKLPQEYRDAKRVRGHVPMKPQA